MMFVYATGRDKYESLHLRLSPLPAFLELPIMDGDLKRSDSLTKLTVARFVSTGCFLSSYSDGYTKQIPLIK